MPEVTYTTTMNISRDDIWEFVKDMNNWAPFVTGYQKHEVIDDTDSIWHLKGDVGVLSRLVQLKAHITAWEGPDKVEFTLTGINEKVDGGGTLLMEDWIEEVEAEAAKEKPKKPWFGRRFLNWLFRKMFKRMHGEGPERKQLEAKPSSKLSFTLRMDAGGVTGPLVNAMLGPMLMPAAEDLANKIAAHLEKEHGESNGDSGGAGEGSEGEAAAA